MAGSHDRAFLNGGHPVSSGFNDTWSSGLVNQLKITHPEPDYTYKRMAGNALR